MPKVLINDGIHATGLEMLKAAGIEVDTNNIAQEDLPEKLPAYDAICVRSATKVRQELIDQCPNLKIIARGGVGLDNIDVDYARSKGIEVYNTPAASSRSVAELAMTHMLNLARSIHLANREMPEQGASEFKVLKKSYSKGIELEGKTLGIIGFGRIGQALGSIAFGMGMKVLPVNRRQSTIAVPVGPKSSELFVHIDTVDKDEMLANADFISIHVPSSDKPILGDAEMQKMKPGVILVNTARGGTVDEEALMKHLESGHIRGAGLDVFVNEPKPSTEILNQKQVSYSPHIGGSTSAAQEKIGIELAEQIIAYFAK